jgi:hypothetical protein
MSKHLKILLLILPNLIFSQIRTYDIIETDTTLTRKTVIHQININENQTFEFRSIPNISCFTWREFKGTWKQKGNLITFKDSFKLQAADIEFEQKNIADNDFFELSFKLDAKSAYSNQSIKISFTYDYDSKIKDVDSIYTTDKIGRIIIPFNKIQNRESLTALRIETKLLNGIKRWNYFTTNKIVNEKENDLPNKILVNIVSKPYEETIVRTTKASISENKISIISSKCEKGKLQNFINDLKFGSEYQRKEY